MPKVKIVQLHKDLPLPSYQTPGSAAMDIHAAEDKILRCGEVALVSTGLKVALPQGYELQIRPRSGLALKHGVTFLNSPGTLDEDYRGELKLIMVNHGKQDFHIRRGDRVGQILLKRYEKIEWDLVDELDPTVRNESAFGSTGK